MNRMKLISAVLVILTEAVSAYEDGEISGDEAISILNSATTMFGVKKVEGFNFDAFIEADGDIHVILKADLLRSLLQKLGEAIS